MKIKLQAALVLTTAALWMGAPATAQAATVCTNSASGTVLLRSGPGQKFRAINSLPNGTYVEYFATTRGRDGFGWDRVRFGRQVGWMRGDYVCG